MRMQAGPLSRRQSVPDKRAALLRAALRLFARDGLSVPTSAISRAAGVATGTLFLYFRSKEELIGSLYLEAISDLTEVMMKSAAGGGSAGDVFRRVWFSRARWHLANPEASSLIRQCEASAVLSPETLAAKAEIEREASDRFDARIASGTLQPWPRPVHFALLEGPILVLAHLRDKGEIEITDEILEMTFQGVARAMMADP